MKKEQEPKKLGHNSKNIIDIPGNDNTLGEDIKEYFLDLSGEFLNIISETEDKHKAIQGEPYIFENELCKETNLHGVERKLTSQEQKTFAIKQSKMLNASVEVLRKFVEKYFTDGINKSFLDETIKKLRNVQEDE